MQTFNYIVFKQTTMKNEDFLYQARDYKSIKIWENISEEKWNDSTWQRQNSIRTIEELKQVIELSQHQENEIQRTISVLKSEGKDPLRITPYYASLMDANPFRPTSLFRSKIKRIDPIFWQSVPTPANLLFPDAGPEGSMNEGARSFGAAYQRYPNRIALLVASNTSCASYCVHCQRAKSMDGTVSVNTEEINKGLFYIQYNENINEVLVSGGDPLMIHPQQLQYILEELSKIPHLRVIRIATRVPVVLPMGITDELMALIKKSIRKHTNGIEKHVYFMTHVNHFKEITPDFAKAVRKIQDYGFSIRNQTVFLNHVNDNFRILAETFRRLFWVGVHPYYLLQCHKEKGILHFIAPVQVGKIYMKHMQGWLSGITVPKYAVNVEGGGGKVLLMPSGHDTLNSKKDIEAEISESSADINTWDHKKIFKYEALGRATKEEYNEALEIMNKFLGRKNVFLPKLIMVDKKGNHLETTNRTNLPYFEKEKKAKLLNYNLRQGMPITNPTDIIDELNESYQNSEYKKRKK